MKKILLGLLLLIIVAVGALFAINGTSNYDPSKYSLSVTLEGKPFGVGSHIDFTLPDQFDKPKSLPDDTQKLLFVFTKPTGHTFKSFMAFQTKTFLQDNKIIAVADISGMPIVIVNTFAMPDFRQSAYSILLIYDKDMAKKLKEGQAVDKVIVMTLTDKKVTHIDHASSEAELAELLGGKAPGQ
jgi:hypothetical protein